MDQRFQPSSLDFTKNTAVFLHPKTSIEAVRLGSIQPPLFGGFGLNDMASYGIYTDAATHPNATFTITIDSVGTGGVADTFTWIDNATGETAALVPIQGVPIPTPPIPGQTTPPQPPPIQMPLKYGISISFGNSTGHRLTDVWTILTANDAVDLSPFVSAGTQSFWEVTVTLSFNNEFFGAAQPLPTQILEIQQGEGIVSWLGVIDSISSFNMSRGSRTMEITARSRDSLNLWRQTKFTSQLYAINHNLVEIVTDVAKKLGLFDDEILIVPGALNVTPSAWAPGTPYFVNATIFDGTNVETVTHTGTSGTSQPTWPTQLGTSTSDGTVTWINTGLPVQKVTTAHTSTQFAGESSWSMFETLFQAMGLTPFVDCIGRLRGADRGISIRTPDILITPDRVIQVKATRMRAPASRVKLMWLDPNLSKLVQVGRRLGSTSLGTSILMPIIWQDIWYSADKTQFAENDKIDWTKSRSANPFGLQDIKLVIENYTSHGDQGYGTILLINVAALVRLIGLILLVFGASFFPDWVVTFLFGGATIPAGRLVQRAFDTLLQILLIPGTGVYEIWGNPYKWLHAKNTTEAFDRNSPEWVDNPVEIANDLIMDVSHSHAVAVRELIYRACEANKWTVDIWEDLRIEYGDILQFSDGSKMYVEDVSRQLARDSNGNITVKGFLINVGASDPSTTGGGGVSTPGFNAPDVFPWKFVNGTATQETTGAGTFGYVIVAKSNGVAIAVSAVGQTGLSSTDLGGDIYIAITWGAYATATDYDVYRTIGGGTGKIANTTKIWLNDTGLSSDGSSVPVVSIPS